MISILIAYDYLHHLEMRQGYIKQVVVIPMLDFNGIQIIFKLFLISAIRKDKLVVF
jgi:hypothetical protein